MPGYCTECGHEFTDRGRYCPFCGNDRKAKRAGVKPVIKQEKTPSVKSTEEYLYKPQHKAIRILASAILIAIITAAILLIMEGAEMNKYRKEYEIFASINKHMTFEQADSALQKAGFIPSGDRAAEAGSIFQEYEGKEVYGKKTTVTVLEAQEESGQISVWHYYDTQEMTGTEKESLYNSLFSALEINYGSPDITRADTEGGTISYWSRNGQMTVIIDTQENVIIATIYTGETID